MTARAKSAISTPAQPQSLAGRGFDWRAQVTNGDLSKFTQGHSEEPSDAMMAKIHAVLPQGQFTAEGSI